MGSTAIHQPPVQFVADPVDGAYLAQMGAEEVPQSTAGQFQQPQTAYQQPIASTSYPQSEPEHYKNPVPQYQQTEPEQPTEQYAQSGYPSEIEPSREQECLDNGDRVSELRAKLA